MAEIGTNSNSLKLLLSYRILTWRKAVLEAVPEYGLTELYDCNKQLLLTRMLVNRLKKNKPRGKKLYWIIYTTYLSNQHLHNLNDVLTFISKKYENIPRSTYFRLRGQALKLLDNELENIINNNLKER